MTVCAAKVPGDLRGQWLVCVEQAVTAHLYRCACGHERRGAACAEHRPVPGDVGCARCFTEGHECEMAAAEIPLTDDHPADIFCPECGEPSRLVISETQAMCASVNCSVLLWDPTLSPAENLARMNVVDLSFLEETT